MIVIYQDYVHNNGSLFKALNGLFGVGNVIFCDRNHINNGILSPEIKAFVMPGGASRYVSAKLDGPGNRAIMDYVANGGLYVGICAGAYYACQRTEWHPDQGPAFSVENQLGLFPGTATGPIPGFAMADIVPLSNGTQAFYWGGPTFTDAAPQQVLARYTANDLPAIVTGTFARGRYLLISPHLEIDSTQLDLMRFDVIDNRFDDIAAMRDIRGLTLEAFSALLKKFIT